MDYVGINPARDLWSFRIGTLGAFGVPVFFLLSAFLITDLLLRERDRTGKVHVASFYMRRILRIWPLYFAIFFGLAILNHFVSGVSTNDPAAYVAFTLFAGNWYILRHGWIAGSVDPLWSISVEEQFYIVIPILAALGGRRTLRWVSWSLFAISYLVILLYALHPTAGDNGQWTNSFFHFQYFSAGTLLAIALRNRASSPPVLVRLLGFAAGLGCWLTAMVHFHAQSWEPRTTVPGAFAGWLLVLAGTILFFLCTLGLPAQFIPRWLAYLGRISYGLYMFHSLVFFLIFENLGPRLARYFPALEFPVRLTDLRNAIGAALVLLLSFGLAHFSYRYFERPFLRLKERFTFVIGRKDA
jgi:peptidoglycan/LPS O-acetylase OafA/YrhL